MQETYIRASEFCNSVFSTDNFVVCSKIFMRDRVLTHHIDKTCQTILLQIFTEKIIISRFSPITFSSWFLNLLSDDFWWWGYLKSRLSQGNISSQDLITCLTPKFKSFALCFKYVLYMMKDSAQDNEEYVQQYLNSYHFTRDYNKCLVHCFISFCLISFRRAILIKLLIS